MEKITEDMVVDWLVSCDLEAETWQIEELTLIINQHCPPPPCDVDGVPLRVGDKVYIVGLDSSSPYTVDGYGYNGSVRIIDGYIMPTEYYYKADEVTHEAPDSWEKLGEDVECGSVPCAEILRRAKRLAGVKDE